ncbi:hypothetical protein PAXRUDRAFT_35482 [Paxillus rubicundulus Ve08.2h10]|uniref:DUF6534 domain-containing protein n=1 Tax=Paxillus rubicundulus Ve08.2h10 TaxID=930991 RepID=A0A0D0DFD4_9AGAM|nr:hypothetical protein PAXRUDRAFT_35482 [Paxillus rubicundulus Ve08.2h10]
MSSVPIVSLDLSLSWGSLLAGTFASLILYGVSILQTFIYYVHYPQDRTSLKLLVVAVLLLDTLHIFLACAGLWSYLVQYYGDFANLVAIRVPLMLATVVTSLVSFVVQSFFVWRIWWLSSGPPKWIVPLILMPFVTAQPDYMVKGLITPTIEAISGPLLTKIANASNGTAAAVDVTIAIAMCTLLAMGRTGFSGKTDRTLLRLIVISINTSLWTALFGFLSVILLITLPQDLVYSGFYFPLCTLYCNTLLASLNVRRYLRRTDIGEPHQLPSASSYPRFKSPSGLEMPVANASMETTKIGEESFERNVPGRYNV